ncbi:chromosome segregation protein SMC [Subtercola boreus]|uniref:Chromosome partition protein Smc n=1 Tax=Subtercola boreus TaxID=120213 RepID=A0A3E0WF09_9MICO|nr:chromosome segregation protein SMC [Subtercola boreus]RFA22012.1 chromosome segregation protein SMC [Subtercola boreus]RFA22192.1 chromosome segregation protein SMC [Subtercola boreus]RFA28054.1 chromosome segregation protein SMC [Subtercola boreus]
MYLKSLTLKGFKSFAQPTTFAFETGVTCVVGPNGSGKSNVVDALAWVMGEQGVKTLRGGKMEDVIFAGTSTRGPLGRAEVVLTIDNSDGALPIDYSEVTIGRTLFRNGGSEYAINGDSCRLLDVQELLSDSGLGREMHVIVGQGQLDAVLHATPEGRRGFIEEAAGILKHRRRKEKTERKLEAMQANLTRLSDLAGELRRQLKPLGRQAEVAKEAQSIASVVRDARARLLADEVVTLRTALDDHSRTENERRTERIVLQERLEQNQLRLGRIVEAQDGDAVDLARRTAFGLESVQERLRGLYTLANQRLALLGSEPGGRETGPGVTPTMVAAPRDEVVRLTGDVVVAEQAFATAQQLTRAARLALDAADEQIAAQSALVSRHDLEISKLTGQLESANSRLAAVRGEDLRQANALDAAALRREALQIEFTALEAQAATADAGETNLDEIYEFAQAAVFEAEGGIEQLRDALHTHERERDALAAKTSALSMALGQKDGSSELAASGVAGVRGLVADHVQVEPGFEVAIAAALGSLADGVLAETTDDAFAALARAREGDMGRVEVIVARGGGSGTGSAKAFAGDGLRFAGEVVTAPEGVHALLAATLIADDLDAARAAWPSIRSLASDSPGRPTPPLTVITRVGDVLTEYVLRGGSGAKRSRLELVAERDSAAARLEVVTADIDRAKFALAEQRGILQNAKQQSQAALAALREFDSRLAAQTERLSRLRAQVDASQGEYDRLDRSRALAGETVATALAAAEKARAELDAARSRPRPILDVSSRDDLLGAVEAAREGELDARLQLETVRERVRGEQARVQALERQLTAERAAAEEAARREVLRRRQVDRATAVVGSLPEVLDSVDRSVATARLELARREAERAEQNAELGELRREEAVLRERLQGITENVHGLELQIYEKKLHLSSVLERVGSELGLIEADLVAEYGPEELVPVEGAGAEAAGRGPADARSSDARSSDANANAPQGIPFDRDDQKRRLAKYERMLTELGRVNPLALEEFEALEQRHRFLTEQLTDLTNTRKDLLTIIDEIDDKMKFIFESAFTDTRDAFAEVFPVLFPGGTGSISLTNPDDLLTTGVEVSVKPAGKKIERLSLLSGGERSLAAVALLIAIFKARPSPFYIMDEVEAALDDANLGRLLTIFEDLRQTSQLIVITHQKRTMEIADALYGVSMRQDGVSAVIGQRVSVAT